MLVPVSIRHFIERQLGCPVVLISLIQQSGGDAVSGKHVTEQQVGLYMANRRSQSQQVAAARAGFLERTGRCIEKKEHQPSKGKKRTWRTRKDPLAAVWDSVVLPMLQETPGLTCVGIFDHLCAYYPDIFDTRTRRTLKRRIKRWRQLHGPEQEIILLQQHGGNLLFDCTRAQFCLSRFP